MASAGADGIDAAVLLGNNSALPPAGSGHLLHDADPPRAPVVADGPRHKRSKAWTRCVRSPGAVVETLNLAISFLDDAICTVDPAARFRGRCRSGCRASGPTRPRAARPSRSCREVELHSASRHRLPCLVASGRRRPRRSVRPDIEGADRVSARVPRDAADRAASARATRARVAASRVSADSISPA